MAPPLASIRTKSISNARNFPGIHKGGAATMACDTARNASQRPATSGFGQFGRGILAILWGKEQHFCQLNLPQANGVRAWMNPLDARFKNAGWVTIPDLGGVFRFCGVIGIAYWSEKMH
ncbi:hypothetical protein KUV89_16565 [Marinobacter hydrocarbonoclasticus]|nr:hypothetical protein [Marinobacter nauticus]